MIPYGRQDITKEDIEAVKDVLSSDFLTQGPKVPEFEKEVANYCDSKFAVAVNSATSALHIACLALGVSKGDLVWTAANTFVASANCALYCGAAIDFVDIDKNTFNISLIDLENKLVIAKQKNNLPKVLIPVHMCGQSCDMRKIKELSEIYGFKIIEDASHAIGGHYLDSKIGSCKYSDITVFSFHPVKIITSGEGGMAITNDEKLSIKMNLYRSHGITRDSTMMENEAEGQWYYEQLVLGFNYRMTDIHAALGLSQFKSIDSNIKIRNSLAEEYNQLLKDLPLELPSSNPNIISSFHLYVIRLKKESMISHKYFFESLRAKKILVNLHYIPVYFHPFYQKLGFKRGYCPNAEEFYSTAVSIPMFTRLTNNDQLFVTNSIKESLGY
tara:strand:- start:10624 stop:11781 length:1158 start_codon:yes stop_codon:yes gene_type:complete